jgi:hypothetical protein
VYQATAVYSVQKKQQAKQITTAHGVANVSFFTRFKQVTVKEIEEAQNELNNKEVTKSHG